MNRALSSLLGGSLEIVLTVPLSTLVKFVGGLFMGFIKNINSETHTTVQLDYDCKTLTIILDYLNKYETLRLCSEHRPIPLNMLL